MRLRLVPDSDVARRALDVIAAVGADTIQIRYSDDEHPTVWVALAGWPGDIWAVGTGFEPDTALVDLARTVAQEADRE